MDFKTGKDIINGKLGTHKVMSIATSVDDRPMVRSVSCIFYNDKIYFKTDKNFKKTVQLLVNNRVALCFWGVQVEGIAKNLGLVVEEDGNVFEEKFKEYYDLSYIAYAHQDTEILVEITPTIIEIWDQKDDYKAFRVIVDYVNETAEEKMYD